MFISYHALFFLLLPGIFTWLLLKLLRRRDYFAKFSERFGIIENDAAQCAAAVAAGERPQPRFWLHAVSAGEATAAIALLAGLRRRYPESYIAISTTTPAGRAILAASKVKVDRIFYSPLDIAWVVRRVIARIEPTLFLIIETDLWPALLRGLARRQTAIVLVNGRISLRRVRFRRLFRPVFALLNHICVQTEADAERLIHIGVKPVKISVTGNLKFAQALGQLEAPPLADHRYALAPGAALLVGGSTHPGEEEELLDCYSRLRTDGRDVFLMIAPRHLERLEAVGSLIKRHGFAVQHWSGFTEWHRDRIILVDSVGNLPRLYSLADFVFVGGSFVGRGGHNILEPAAWGKPIFFGPYMENYSSIAETAVREGAAIQVGRGAELAEQVAGLLDQPAQAAAMGRKANALVRRNQGVVERDLAIIESLLNPQYRVPQSQVFPSNVAAKALAVMPALPTLSGLAKAFVYFWRG
ncbi:MAG TPA: glycosyltransferase N-terminal domain-containing protein [Pseudorhodoplanes sp.]|nr:glycosyltransferase N-terminal domain-containing protein [Pseudorhodoplanes sp.]